MTAAATSRSSPASTPDSLEPMNDHHFSYPVVVPLRGATISGHAVQDPAPVASPQAARRLAPPIRHAAAVTPARTQAALAA
jgi:hypothetical protein